MRPPALTARRTVVAVGAALLAAGAWWFVRAPAVERRAVATAPEIDIDPPALRARREAAMSLATMPDDPWTFAETIAASAPAAGPTREDCGIDGRPAFSRSGSPDAGSTRTGGPSSAYVAAQARVDAELRTSADPLDRAVADWLNVGGMRTEDGRDEAVAQQAAATSDPRLFALGYGLCRAVSSAAPSCRALSAERWTQIDVGNGIPWVAMLGLAQARGDAAGVSEAMAQLAASTRFDVYAEAAAGAVAGRVTDDERELAAIGDLATTTALRTVPLTAPSLEPLFRACRPRPAGDQALAQACQAISDAMFEHSDSLAVQSTSGALLLQATGDASRRDIVRAERAVAEARWSPATGFSECRVLRDGLRTLLRNARIGEVAGMREDARRFVAP